MKFASRSRRWRQEGGQALLEYVLLITLMSGLTFGYLQFYGKKVLGEGMTKLKAKVGTCISHGNTDCQ